MSAPLHPVFLDHAWLAQTGPVKAFNQAVTDAVRVGLPSLLVQGPSGSGKTAAGTELFDYLGKRADKQLVPWRASAIGAKTRADLPRFLRTFEGPHGAGNASAVNGFTITSDMEKAVNSLLLSADEAKCQRILLFIDEAQELEYPVLVALKGLSERLLLKRVHMLTLLFAEPDIQQRIRELKSKSSGPSVVQRFFASTYFHRGLTLDDLATLMTHVDTARFPEEGGPTYTEHFAPALSKNGWRLGALAPQLWHGFFATAQSMRLDVDEFELMPRFAVRALRFVVSEIAKNRSAVEDVPALMLAAVRNSGFVQAHELEQSLVVGQSSSRAPRRRLQS